MAYDLYKNVEPEAGSNSASSKPVDLSPYGGRCYFCMRKIKCACLEPTADKKIFTVDANWKGDSDKSKDKAFISLIFEIGGEALRPVSGGLERAEGAVQAWKLVLRS